MRSFEAWKLAFITKILGKYPTSRVKLSFKGLKEEFLKNNIGFDSWEIERERIVYGLKFSCNRQWLGNY